MRRLTSLFMFFVVIGLATAAGAQAPIAHRFIQVAPGVYAAIGNGTIETRVTSGVIINDHDVVLVDTNVTPEATRRLVNDIRTLTDKPIRYVVNTHGHHDHAGGNQIFGPDVSIIGHSNARTAILAGALKDQLAFEVRNLREQLDDIRKQIASERNPVRKAQLQGRLRIQGAYQKQLMETVPTPPNVSVDDRMTIFRGDREIRLIHPGRGHSDSDILVYLPKDKVMLTGDFFEGPVTGVLDFGFHDEWANNLEKLKTYDYETTIAGHGEPFKGKERIGDFQAFLRDLWSQATALHDQKVPVADAAARIDLSAHKMHYPDIDGPGFQGATIARIYQLLDQRAGNN